MKSLARITWCVFLMCCLASAASYAGWVKDGVPLTRQMGSVGVGMPVSDGSSGAIIAYEACHAGAKHIMAQRVDPSGVLLWGQEGVVMGTASGEQVNLDITPDGAGGAIVTWQDWIGGDYDICAQRVNASGVVQWAVDGVVLCTAAENQYNPAIVSDGTGGAVVTWQDSRSGLYSSDIYAQRLNASGVPQWMTNGVPLCTAAGTQVYPSIVSDGAAGAIVTWDDRRVSGDHIYAQRVNASGAVQWTVNGVALCTATGSQPYYDIISDGAGGAIVTWQDTRGADHDIYAQRVNASGAAQWTADGVPLCTATGQQSGPRITSDGSGGAIVLWHDLRGSGQDIYAQRVNGSGAAQWAADGVALCTATGDQFVYGFIPDGAGGAIVMWMDSQSGDWDIYAQRINGSGAVQWAADGIALCTATGDQYVFGIIPDGAGGAIVTWQDYDSGNLGIYAQRMNVSGTVQWTVGVVALGAPTGVQDYPAIVSDGAGGAIATWVDARNGGNDIYAQRVNASGVVQWAADGVAVCTATADQGPPKIATDGAGGAIVTWVDARNGGNDIYAQRVNASGAVQWTADGVALCTATGDQDYLTIISDGAGGAIVTWQDNRNGVDSDVYTQWVNVSGAVQWMVDGVAICTATGEQKYPTSVSDGAGGAIVTWQDNRNGVDKDIYAQWVNASGAVQWTVDGVAICTATGDQVYSTITSDGAGGAIITWEDGRGYDDDIYAQRVNASGAVQWTADGVAICTAHGEAGGGGPFSSTYSQYAPQIISDGTGGAIIAWSAMWQIFDYFRFDIYGQRVDASGAVQWAENGVGLGSSEDGLGGLQIISDGVGGAIATFQLYRSGYYYDIYARRVDISGAFQWSAALCTATASQMNPAITSDGADGAVIAWKDNRCGEQLIFAQRVTASGELVATTLQNHSAALEGSSVRVEWALSEIDADVRFSILRASAPEWEYVELEGAAISREKLSFSFIDASCLPGATYKYRVECEAEGMPKKLLFESEEITIPALPVTLYPNYPNPFNPSTRMRFYLPEAQEIALDIYNVAGERVARLAEGKKEKGYHEFTWDGRNIRGTVCSSGVYFCRLTAGKSSISRKIVITR